MIAQVLGWPDLEFTWADTGSASPYGNQVSTNFSPQPVTLEGVNIAKFGGPTFKFQNLAYQDQLILSHQADFTAVAGTVAMTGAYQLYVFDFARGLPYDIFLIDGARNLALEAPVFMRNLLRWYDTTQGASSYNAATGLLTGGTYNQTTIRASIYNGACLPTDGAGSLTGGVGDVYLCTQYNAGATASGVPFIERYVCVSPSYGSGGTPVAAVYMHSAPLQLSGPRAALTPGAVAYGYARGVYYEYTDPIAGDFEGLKVVDNGGSLVWKPVRPIAA